MTQWITCFGLLALTSAMVGCGSTESGPQAAVLCDVAGTVQLDGMPMPDGEIAFSVAGGGPNIMAIKDGQFSGKTSAGEKHVEIRKYRAGKPVMMGDVANDPEPENYLPAKYNSESTLTATIASGGTKDLKFDVTSK